MKSCHINHSIGTSLASSSSSYCNVAAYPIESEKKKHDLFSNIVYVCLCLCLDNVQVRFKSSVMQIDMNDDPDEMYTPLLHIFR